jgi:hypothetical protein
MHIQFQHLLIFAAVAIPVWAVFIYLWPRLLLSAYKRAILNKGFGGGPIPINTIYTEPQELFADPIALQSGARSNPVSAGMNHDTLLTLGWLDLGQGPLALHVPDMPGPDSAGPASSGPVTTGRYYSVQFTDTSKNTAFAYVGTRTTGTQAGDYLITGPGWKGTVPQGLKQIASPNNPVLLLARVLVYSDSDLPAAYALSKQIQLTPPSQWKPGH